jgi:dolichol-phosphate mannosyltransferase
VAWTLAATHCYDFPMNLSPSNEDPPQAAAGMPSSQAQELDPVLTVVVPMYNEEGNVAPFVEALVRALDDSIAWEAILVNDGSTDATWERILEAAGRDPRIHGVRLARNFGHQNALFAGLHHARGRAIVTMDGDLQHPPQVILQLLDAWRRGYKVVNTERRDSQETPAFKRLTSRWFYALFSRLSGVTMAAGSSDFRLIDAQALDALKNMRDTDLFLRGIVHWLGYPSTTIAFQVGKRFSGRTKYSLRRMMRFSTTAILSFSMLPLRLGIWVGFLTSLLAIGEIVYILVRWAQGVTIPGWASMMVVLSFLFAVLFFLIGIVGMYLGEIFEILKSRPRFVVLERTAPAPPNARDA